MSLLGLAIGAVVLIWLVLRNDRSGETIVMPRDGLMPGDPDSVESLILAGRKIEAIKRLREETGSGLKEAKEQVEALERNLRRS